MTLSSHYVNVAAITAYSTLLHNRNHTVNCAGGKTSADNMHKEQENSCRTHTLSERSYEALNILVPDGELSTARA